MAAKRTYTPKKIQTGVDQKTDPKSEPKGEQKHTCNVDGCENGAVIRHTDGNYYCQTHYDLRLMSVSHNKMKIERTVPIKSVDSNFSGKAKAGFIVCHQNKLVRY